MTLKKFLSGMILSLAREPSSSSNDQIKNQNVIEFRQNLVDEWHKQSGTEPKTRFNNDTGALHIEGTQLNVESLFEAYSQADSKKKWIVEFVQTVLKNRDLTYNFEDYKKQIFPMVRPTKWFATQNMYMNESQDKQPDKRVILPHEEMNLYLSVGLLIGEPQEDKETIEYRLKSITSADLEKWDKTFEEVLEVAKQNLLSQEYKFTEIEPGVWACKDRWESDANIMFLPHVFEQLSVKGGHVAMHPHKGWVLVTGSEDIKGLKQTFEISDDLMQDRGSLSGHIYVLKDKSWENYIPERSHPLYEEIILRNFKADQSDSYYLEKCIEEDLKRKNDQETYLARFKINEEIMDQFAVLLPSKKSIIPAVNTLVLDVFPEEIDDEIFDSCLIPIRDFLDVCGHRTRKYPYSNDYFILEGFPDTNELKRFGVKVEHMKETIQTRIRE